MAKKFKFDVDNLDFQNESPKNKKIKNILTQFVAVVLLGIIIFFVLSYFMNTSAEKNLKYQNKIIKQEYERLLLIYEQNEKNLRVLEQQDYNLYQVMFGTLPPNNKKVQLMADIQNKKPKELLKDNKAKLHDLDEHLKDTKEEFYELMSILENQKEEIINIPSIQPVPNSNLNFLLYGYGKRLDPIYHTPNFHPGIDFSAPIGTPVFATANGVVKVAGKGKKEFGNVIEIKHGDFTTIYHHLDKVKTKKGRKVERGEIIGYVGTTGKSLVSHLHYEIRYKGEHINPIFFFFMDLTPAQFSKVYQQSVTAGISLD